jgi:hypothetical protein
MPPRLCLITLIEYLEKHYNRLYSIYLDTRNVEHEERLNNLLEKMMRVIETLRKIDEKEKSYNI